MEKHAKPQGRTQGRKCNPTHEFCEAGGNSWRGLEGFCHGLLVKTRKRSSDE